MSKMMGTILLVLGVIVVGFGLANHYALKLVTVSHFSLIVAVVGGILAVAGLYGMVSSKE